LDNSDEDNRHQCSKNHKQASNASPNIIFLQMTANVTLRQNSHAKKINPGADRNAFLKSGFAMAIPIVLMEQMKIQHCTIAQHLSLARRISFHVRTDGASTRAGLAIMTMIAAMALMKENSATLNTKHAHRKSLHVKTSNVFVISTDAVC